MKHLTQIILVAILALILTSCNSSLPEIPIEKVSVSDKTKLYTFKNTKEKVTGNVISSETENNIIFRTVEKVVDGHKISCVSYFPNGNKNCEYNCDSQGKIKDNVTWYYENKQINETRPFLNGKANGIAVKYDENGKKNLETHYKDDKIIKEYRFDKNGNKIIPASDNLELVKIETGFYKNDSQYEILYQPIVLMKLVNKSSKPLSENIHFKAVFIDDAKNEELSSEQEYFQIKFDSPLQPNIARQLMLKSSVGVTHPYATQTFKISCVITLNDEPYKTLKINNKILYSNRIQ